MAIFQYHDIGISALSSAVPVQKHDNLGPNAGFTKEEADAIVDKTGIRYRRIANSETCASDLCFAAAEQIFSQANFDKETVDAVIFVSQTPDYRMPATAIALQHRLNLPKDSLAFDVNLGCSGFIHGLSLAYSYCSQPSVRRVLLLNGETRSKAYSPLDKQTGLLFGDAGSAAIIEKQAGLGRSVFTANSDGGQGDKIMIPCGGYRVPSSYRTLEDRVFPDGSVRNGEQGVMNGKGVFEFLLLEVPKDIGFALSKSELSIDDIDFLVLHQANRFMNEHLRRRLKFPAQKVPYSLQDFGNTSSVSIPLTIASQLGREVSGKRTTFLLSGFGVGLSWGSAVVPLEINTVCPLVEYGQQQVV